MNEHIRNIHSSLRSQYTVFTFYEKVYETTSYAAYMTIIKSIKDRMSAPKKLKQHDK